MNNVGNESDASNLATITTDENSQLNYCTSQSANVNEEYISNVQIAAIDNTSDARFYSNFTNTTTNLVKNGQYNITITPTWTGISYNEGYAVWINYNQNGNFNDSGEQIFVQTPTTQTTVNTIFAVPTSAPNGVTKMRVFMKYDAIPGQCETFIYGEVEDYSVNIISATPDPIPPFITLIGDNPIEIFINDTYIDAGATAIDNFDGDVTNLIV